LLLVVATPHAGCLPGCVVTSPILRAALFKYNGTEQRSYSSAGKITAWRKRCDFSGNSKVCSSVSVKPIFGN
jgi:hypothetical protein